MAIDNRLTISKAVFDQLTTLARKEAPLEACGLLAGIDKNGVVWVSLGGHLGSVDRNKCKGLLNGSNATRPLAK